MTPYSCQHVRLRVLRHPLLRVAFLYRGQVIFEGPCLVNTNGQVLHSPHMPQIAGYCFECGEACGWRAG